MIYLFILVSMPILAKVISFFNASSYICSLVLEALVGIKQFKPKAACSCLFSFLKSLSMPARGFPAKPSFMLNTNLNYPLPESPFSLLISFRFAALILAFILSSWSFSICPLNSSVICSLLLIIVFHLLLRMK